MHKFSIGKDDNSCSTSGSENSEDEVDSIDECDMPSENHNQNLNVETEIVETNDIQTITGGADEPQTELATIVNTSLGDGLSVVEVCCVGVLLCVAFRPFSSYSVFRDSQRI
jgi:hypothetical protein